MENDLGTWTRPWTGTDNQPPVSAGAAHNEQ
jgi:hypothetical protein